MSVPARALDPGTAGSAAPSGVAAHGAEREVTTRAVAAGLVVGALLCVANLYTGLQAGLWDSGHVTASVLAFALASAIFGARLSRLENNTAQTIAAAAGAMPAAAGLFGAVPALALLGRAVPAWALVLWGLSLGALGVLIAMLLRRRLLEEEALPFPTGVATAEVIEALHAGDVSARSRTRTLLFACLGAAIVAWFRQGRPAWIPSELLLPAMIAGIPAATLTLGASTSPMLLGIGMVAGLRMGLSLLFGSVLAWAVGAPLLVTGRLHLAAGYGELSSWLTWPGVGLLVGAALAALASEAPTFKGAVCDLVALSRGGQWGRLERLDGTTAGGVALALVASLAVIAVGKAAFGLQPAHAALALLLSVIFASVCARSAGLTDISPLGSVGQLTQAAFGGLAPGQPGLNVAAGSVVAGDSAQTSVALWSMRAGRSLGASPRKMGAAALMGVGLGSVLCVPAYLLLVKTHGLASARLPMPGALQWKALAEVVSRGAAAFPPGALPAFFAAAALGLLLAVLQPTRAGALLPTPFAMGMGLLLPVHLAVAVALGGALVAAGDRLRPGFSGRFGAVAGAGAIAGESLVGLAVALLVSFGALQP